MNNRHPTMLDILTPKFFPGNQKRAKVTRTIRQVDADTLGLSQAVEFDSNDAHHGAQNAHSATSQNARSGKLSLLGSGTGHAG